MDGQVWCRLEQTSVFLLALDWNRALGRRDLPRDIVRIIFDMVFARDFLLYYEWCEPRCEALIRNMSDNISSAGNVEYIKKCAKTRRKTEYELRRLQDVVLHYRGFSNLFADMKIKKLQKTDVWVMGQRNHYY